MKKFVRVLSPITVAVVGALDCAVIAFCVYAVQRIMAEINIWTIAFVVIDAIAIIIAILTTKEALTNGVKFDDSKLEFTGLDSNNEFEYKDIQKITTSKDTKASLKKNFVDRYSHITLYMNDDTMVTIDLGLTTKRTLNKIRTEIESRIK